MFLRMNVGEETCLSLFYSCSVLGRIRDSVLCFVIQGRAKIMIIK